MAGLLAATLTASLVAGCTTAGNPGDDGRGRPHPTSSDRTGTGSALAVKIDNARAARPQTGLNEADIVYVEQVEGGLSRLMAVYATRLPKTVGPVRSARESDLELLAQFDRPTLAFSGAQSKLLPLIDKAPLRAEPPGRAAGAYVRGTDRPAPHNLFLRPRALVPNAPGTDVLTTGYRFGAAPAGGEATAAQSVRYPAARFTFTWSGSEKRWLVAMDGRAASTADGGRIGAGTVVVQYVKVRTSSFGDFLGNNTPFTETVGAGTARVLRDGRAYDVRWKRAKAADGTTFTTRDGRPMTFQHGQVWVVFAKAS
ncbi:hypothetical protein SZN_28043 [Streptomyces zinciresistens K42]|uniref:Secreted protein n=1 Tax=Streptomyces zinciresistens K42 TaxID=700597 RepID=G2GJB6_9ACTN|nr:hypothetical protein SZN_28043 [Streptomyces zinciresistens K42]